MASGEYKFDLLRLGISLRSNCGAMPNGSLVVPSRLLSTQDSDVASNTLALAVTKSNEKHSPGPT